MLHDANACPKVEKPKAESCLVSTSMEVLYLDRLSSLSHFLLKVIRVLLHTRDRTLYTYAILDNPEAVDKVGLHKKPEDLALRTI